MWTALLIALAVTVVLFMFVVLFSSVKAGAEADERNDQLLETLLRDNSKFLN